MAAFKFLPDKWVKRFAQIFSLAAIGFVFQACYGPPRDYPGRFDITVLLFDEDKVPLKDMEVIFNDSIRRITNEDGYSLAEFPMEDSLYKVQIPGKDRYETFDTVISRDNRYSVWLEVTLKKK